VVILIFVLTLHTSNCKHNRSRSNTSQAILISTHPPHDGWRVKLAPHHLRRDSLEYKPYAGKQAWTAYVPPECAFAPTNAPLSPQPMDMYCLGAILYRVLAGEAMVHSRESLRDYYGGWRSFGAGELARWAVGEEGIDFVQKLMMAEAGKRPTVQEAIGDVWISGHERYCRDRCLLGTTAMQIR
jgi:hypothetical protein